MTNVDAFLTNCRIADGRLVDIAIAGGSLTLKSISLTVPVRN